MRSNLLRTFAYLRPYRFRVALGVGLTLLMTLSNFPGPLIVQYFIDEVVGKARWEQLYLVLILIIGRHFIRGVLSYFLTYTISYLGQRIIFDLRRAVFDHLQKLSLSFYDKKQTGKIMTRVIDDVSTVQSMISGQFITAFTDVITLGVVVGMLFYKNWTLALISVTVIPFYLANYRYFRTRLRAVSRRIRESWDRVFAGVQETIAGVFVVKTFAQEEREAETFRAGTWDTMHLSMEQNRTSIVFSAVAASISGLGTALVLWYGGFEVIRGNLTTGQLMAFYWFLGFLYDPAVRLTELNSTLQQSIVSIDRVFEVLDTKPDVEDEGTLVLPKIEGRVTFRNVCFGYSPDVFVLDRINVEVEPGMMVALVGHTGCGKTTLVNLIPRFYDPVIGTVLIDDYDIREVTLDSLRAQIGIVLQESILFDETIRNNIRYGKLDATDDEIHAAATIANIHDYIVSLPDGYATKIGDEGMTLS
ncbi:MAG: ABC transporter ATP-binding protein, partial [Candidatus Latescibacteria bacterium]|nr:ABC transporter ATP-binding protein [Candidatus Latescibacterota bacterium]